MGAEEKNMNEILSRIVADLFTSAGSEDLSAKIQTLRQEIKKVIEREDTLFGKFLEVAESFREIIPEENKRYSAAVKALVTTSKISRQEIVKAVNTQLEELKVLEKILLATTSGGRDKIKGVEARAREIKDEITKLRGEIGRLESEGKEVLAHLAAQEKAVEPAEKAVRQLFADITAEIGLIKKRVEEPTTAERAVLQPVPPGDPGAGGIPGDGGQTSDFSVPAAPPQDTGSQKRCPMCGGRMDLQMDGKTMLCYSCAYQELKAEKEKGGEQ